jgi:hypothetical protein
MTGRATRRRARTALAGATLAAVTVAASVATLSTRTPGAPAVVTHSDDRPVAVVTSDHHPSRRSRSARSTPDRPAGVLGARVATRTFLRGFLAFEMGDATARSTHRVRAAASPRLARLLLAAAPRRPLSGPAPRRAQLRKLDLYSDGRGRAKAVATLARGADVQRLELTLHREAGGWRVTDLG